MREMKESGISWIKEIPKEWSVNRLKYIVNSLSKGNGITKEDVIFDGDTPCVRYGEIYSKYDYSFRTCVSRTNKDRVSSPQYFSYGDILFAGTGELIEEIGMNIVYLGNDQCLAGGDIIIAKHNQNPAFLNYALNSSYIQAQKGYGKAKLKVVHISAFDLGNLIVALPPFVEQKRIADYLDSKCEVFSSEISDIQSQIEALEEYKRSVITEAVTKGLDPDVEMKDSGIAWVGNVPKHWLIEKVKFHLSRNEPRNPGDKQVLSVYREYGVIPKDSRDDNHNVTSEDTSNYKYVVPGNLVINKMKAWQGSMGISDYEGIVSPAYFIYKFTNNLLLPKYLHYLFRSCYKDEFRRISGGIREGQWDLSPYEFSNTLLLLPPVDEQKRIIDYIDSKIDDIERVIIEKKQQIETIEEYKKSLIFEYVTGKKEVQ